jgi:hypothetical protein
MSLSRQQATDIRKCECDLEFNGKSMLSTSEPTLIGNLLDESISLMKVEDQICKSSTPKFMIRGFPMAQNTDNEFINEVNMVKRESKFKTASPSVIRKGLCMVRNESKLIIF